MSFFNKRQNGLHLGIGYAIDDYHRNKFRDLYQLHENRRGHTFIAGSTGFGKTRLFQNLIRQDIRDGRSVGIIDPKGDWELWTSIVEEAYRAKREKELLFLSPFYPQYSSPVNALSDYMIEDEPINHIVAGVPINDEFFFNVALETTTVIVKTLLLQKKYEDRATGKLTFEEVAALASYEGILKCREIVEPICKVEKGAEKVLTLIEQVASSPKDYFSKISTTLRTTLTQMTIGNTGLIMGSQRENELIRRLEAGEQVIFYAQTGSMLTKEVSKIMSRILVSMLQSLAGRLFAKNNKLSKPMCLYMDEFSNMVYLGIESFFNKGGGAGFWLTAATQSLADIEATVGQERARMIFDNCNSKVFMRVNDLKTAVTLAAYGGVKKKYSPMFSNNGGITTREMEEDMIRPDEFLNLQKREFFYFGLEGRFFGKTAPVEPCELKIGINDKPISGVGESMEG
jgi:type IV secretory pathway TraG/TraD family ATPase VirD4